MLNQFSSSVEQKMSLIRNKTKKMYVIHHLFYTLKALFQHKYGERQTFKLTSRSLEVSTTQQERF